MTQPPPSQQAIPRSFVISDRTVEYTEHRGDGAPHPSFGALGDLYIDLKTPPNLFAHCADGWKKWPGSSIHTAPLEHPVHPSHILWATTRRVLWLAKASRKVLLGKPAHILAEIIKSEGKREGKNLKRKAGEPGTTADVKKPRVSIPTASETPEPSPVASSAQSGSSPAKPSTKLASSVTPASIKAPLKENPSPTTLATPVKPHQPVKPTASPLQKRPTDPLKPVSSGPSTPNPITQCKPISPLPDLTVKTVKSPAVSPSQKRPAPKAPDDDDAPRKRQCVVQPPSPAAIEGAMNPVNRVLQQLKARGMISEDKKRAIVIIGQHIEQVLEQKEDDREQWQTALWDHVARFWPRQVTGKKLEAGFKREAGTSTHSRTSTHFPLSWRSTPTPRRDSGKASASTPVAMPGAAESSGHKLVDVRDEWTASASHAATKTKPAAKPAVVPEPCTAPVPVLKPASVSRCSTAQAPSEPTAKPAAISGSGAAPVPELKPALATDVGKTKTISTPTKPADAKSAAVPESRAAPARDYGSTGSVPPPAAKPSVVQASRTVSAHAKPAGTKPAGVSEFRTGPALAQELATTVSSPPPSAKPTLIQTSRTDSASAVVAVARTAPAHRSDVEVTSTPATKAAEPAVTVPPAAQSALVDPRMASVPPSPAKFTRTVSAPTTTLAASSPAPASRSASLSVLDAGSASAPAPAPAAKPALTQADGTVRASTQPQPELDALLIRVRNHKQIIKDTQASSLASFPVVLTAHTDTIQITTSPFSMPDSVSIAALRRQYDRYHSRDDSERHSNDRWLAEAAASAALINSLTRANDALTRENEIIKEENMRLKESAQRADPNSREPSTSTLTSPTTEPAVHDGQVTSPQSQRLSVERDDVVPSAHSEYLPPLPMEEATHSEPPQDKMEEDDEEEEHRRLSVEVVPSSQSDYLLPMEGGENSRMSQDGLEEEEHEQPSVEREYDSEVVPSSQSDYLLPMGGGEDSRMSQDMLEESDVERIEPRRSEAFDEVMHSTVEEQCGAEPQMVVEGENTSQPEPIQIKREPTNALLTLGNPERPEIIDLTLDDSDDEMEGTSSAAPAPTATRRIPCPLDAETTQRDTPDAHGGDMPTAGLDESTLVKASTTGNFCIAGVDFTFTDALLLDVVSHNGGENDATLPTWGKILAYLQVIARKSTGDDIEINPWTETIAALRCYYERHLAPSSSRHAPQSPLYMRDISVSVPMITDFHHPPDQTLPIQESGIPAQESIVVLPSPAALVDPAECKITTRLTEIKVENCDSDLSTTSAGIRRLNRAHLLELFSFRDGLMQCNACLNESNDSNTECQADTLEGLSAHVEDRHLQLFNHILAETAGMDHDEIGEWFKQFDNLSGTPR